MKPAAHAGRALWAVVIVLGTPARAEPFDKELAPIDLAIDPCVPLDHIELRRLTSMELRVPVAGQSATRAATTQIVVQCANALIHVQVRDPLTGKSLARTLDLNVAAATARPRLLALAIAELVIASWIELEANPTPAVPAAGEKPPAEALRAARQVAAARSRSSSDDALSIEAVLGLCAFEEAGALWGGGVRVVEDRGHLMGWSADLRIDHGSSKVALGDVAIDVVSASVSLLAHWQHKAWTARTGLTLRAGTVRLVGEPAPSLDLRADSVFGPWSALAASGGVSIAVSSHLRIDVLGEGGYVLLPVAARVGGARAVAADGAWGSVGLGLGLVR